MKQLILGGMRSGKSELASRLARQSGLEVVFIATAAAGDEEMAERIARHARERPRDWLLVEEPIELLQALAQYAAPQRCLIVDCLTLWLSNIIERHDAPAMATKRQELARVLPQLQGQIILVSNEIGLGVIPLGAYTRRYCDELGWLHQALAASADRVILTIAGLPLVLKGAPL